VSAPKKITFYSFKGGVGRTLALLDVAVLLARAGQRVVAVDMDLEAPGVHRYPAIRPSVDEQLGVSDYILDRLTGPERPVEPHAYRPNVRGVDERLVIVPAGQRPGELAEAITQIYEPLGERALIFQLFVARLTKAFSPDFILFDSRTGLAEIAAVCTVELADAIVALTGLNPQGIDGLSDVIERIRTHPARQRPAAFILAYGPIPRAEDFDIKGTMLSLDSPDLDASLPHAISYPLATQIAQAHAKLWTEAIVQDELEVRQWFPKLPLHERLHFMEYDPLVPLVGEDDFDRPGPLRDAHRRLARSIGLLAGREDLFPAIGLSSAQSPLELSRRISNALDQSR
jgi:MinD-like ATPase involved in chromosome partitioning or flagellar assembly